MMNQNDAVLKLMNAISERAALDYIEAINGRLPAMSGCLDKRNKKTIIEQTIWECEDWFRTLYGKREGDKWLSYCKQDKAISDWLEKLYSESNYLKKMCDRKEKLIERIYGISSPELGDKIQSSPADLMSEEFSELDYVERVLMRRLPTHEARCETLMRYTPKFVDERRTKIIEERYVYAESWKQVGKNVGLTSGGAYNLRCSAIKELNGMGFYKEIKEDEKTW